MAMIAAVALIVPKISKPIERWINEKRRKMHSEREEEQCEQPSLAEFLAAADTVEEKASEGAEENRSSCEGLR